MTTTVEAREEEKAAAEMELRDGNYLLSVFVSPLGATLSIEVEQKTDARRWRGDFTTRYIEDITKRAGNVKSFSNFVKMLRSATTPSSRSQSLHVDVLTYHDLAMLKAGKHKGAAIAQKDSSSFSNSAAASDKRYLILTYTTEFDRVHYPLPLLPEDEDITEETASMRRYIQRLQSELESMKTRLKKYESPQLTFHHQNPKSCTNSKTSSNDNTDDENLHKPETPLHHEEHNGGTRPVDSTRTHDIPSPNTRALYEKVKALEDRLRTEAMAHRKSITTLMRKNTLLEDEAREARVAERRTTKRLRDSEFQIGLLRGRLKSLNTSTSGASSNNVSPFRARRLQRPLSSPPILSRYPNQFRSLPSSTPPNTTRSRHISERRLKLPSNAVPTGRYVLHGPSSLPPRSRDSSPLYSPHSTTPPSRLRAWGRSASCPTRSSRTPKDNWRPTSSARVRKGVEMDYWRPTNSSRTQKDMEIEDWRQAASRQTERCATPPSATTTRTTTPRRSCESRSYEPAIQRRSKNRKGDSGVNDAVSEVGEIDSRLSALQNYLKRMNSQE